jgi:hypothetical protein
MAEGRMLGNNDYNDDLLNDSKGLTTTAGNPIVLFNNSHNERSKHYE